MENIIIGLHVLVALTIIGLILLQQGKGATAGASFGGGASQTVFGSQGGGGFFAKITAVLAFIFFVTSFSLTIIAKNQSAITLEAPAGVPQAEELFPASTVDIPEADASLDEPTLDIPTVDDS